MRKITFLALVALVVVPAALASNGTNPSSASAMCKQQQTAMGTKAFTLLYGGSKNAFGRCVSKTAGTLQSDSANASKQCDAERADASFGDTHNGMTFDQFYGTGKHGANAFGKCVSTKTQALDQASQSATINAAKTCKAQRSQLGTAAFTKQYGGGKNAFGKCVAKTTKSG